MKYALLLISLLFLMLSCKEKSPASNLSVCGVKDPVRNLPWLKNIIDEAKNSKEDKHLTLTVATLRGEPVINYTMSYMSCLGCVAYHCDGSRVDFQQYTEDERKAYQDEVFGEGKKGVVIWPEK